MALTKGFVTIATGKEQYYKIARNLLLSYRFTTKNALPFAILCDAGNEYTQEFDDVCILENPSRSYLDKLNMFDALPYDINIFIDADCLVFRDINRLFDVFENADDFSCFGDVLPLDHKRCWFDYQHLNEDLQTKLEYGIDLHGGIYYMRKTDRCKKIFRDAKIFSENYEEYNFRAFTTPADEPVIALSMATNKCKPSEHGLDGILICYWEYEKCFEMNIPNGVALCKSTGNTSDIIHFGTTHTYSLTYKKVVSDLESHIGNKKLCKITFADYLQELSIYAKRFLTNPKSAIKKLVNLIKKF